MLLRQDPDRPVHERPVLARGHVDAGVGLGGDQGRLLTDLEVVLAADRPVLSVHCRQMGP